MQKKDLLYLAAKRPIDEDNYFKKECNLLFEAFGNHKNYRLITERKCTRLLIKKRILENNPDIFQLSFHGSPSGALFVLGEHNSNKEFFNLGDLVSILKELVKANPEKKRYLILNACFSDNQIKSISKYFDFAITFREQLPQEVNIEFLTGFYTSLKTGYDFEQASKFGLAFVSNEDYKKYIIFYSNDEKATQSSHLPSLSPIQEVEINFKAYYEEYIKNSSENQEVKKIIEQFLYKLDFIKKAICYAEEEKYINKQNHLLLCKKISEISKLIKNLHKEIRFPDNLEAKLTGFRDYIDKKLSQFQLKIRPELEVEILQGEILFLNNVLDIPLKVKNREIIPVRDLIIELLEPPVGKVIRLGLPNSILTFEGEKHFGIRFQQNKVEGQPILQLNISYRYGQEEQNIQTFKEQLFIGKYTQNRSSSFVKTPLINIPRSGILNQIRNYLNDKSEKLLFLRGGKKSGKKILIEQIEKNLVSDFLIYRYYIKQNAIDDFIIQFFQKIYDIITKIDPKLLIFLKVPRNLSKLEKNITTKKNDYFSTKEQLLNIHLLEHFLVFVNIFKILTKNRPEWKEKKLLFIIKIGKVITISNNHLIVALKEIAESDLMHVIIICQKNDKGNLQNHPFIDISNIGELESKVAISRAFTLPSDKGVSRLSTKAIEHIYQLSNEKIFFISLLLENIKKIDSLLITEKELNDLFPGIYKSERFNELFYPRNRRKVFKVLKEVAQQHSQFEEGSIPVIDYLVINNFLEKKDNNYIIPIPLLKKWVQYSFC